MAMTQILVSIDYDTYRVGVSNLIPDEDGYIHGFQYHDVYGNILIPPDPISFRPGQIVSDRPLRSAPPDATIYHFSSTGTISASEYATAGRDPLRLVTQHGLGSGIYGLYAPNEEALDVYRRDWMQQVYPIPCPRPLYLQDEEHGTSLTQASKATDDYVDFIISAIRQVSPDQIWQNQPVPSEPICNQLGASGTLSQITQFMVQAEANRSRDTPGLEGLQILWNNVLAREVRQIMVPLNGLILLLGSYILLYLSNPGRLIPEPVTYLLVALNFDSLFSEDPKNNNFGRGCVRYCPFTDLPESFQQVIRYSTRAQRPAMSAR